MPGDILQGLKATLGDELMERIEVRGWCKYSTEVLLRLLLLLAWSPPPPPSFLTLQKSKILVVGAGGIGCELLKDLALSGFRDIEVIDLDTIDVSNLNRQLLFRSQHVGMPKCTVACEVAATMAPPHHSVKYVAHHGNVCDNDKFNVQFVKRFDLVLNALDNITARRRVNRLCLAAGRPLVEAGTTGYLGQVNVIDKESNVACYECTTQETPKVYPICTIRSTPSMPVHTIVWAKELYKLLFGEKEAESMLYEDPQAEEKSTFMDSVTKFRDCFQKKDRLEDQAKEVIKNFYTDEIEKQLSMDRYKTAQKTPKSLDVSVIEAGALLPTPSAQSTYKSTEVWSPEQCVAEFVSCLKEAEPDSVLPSFDKDDSLCMRFVTCASNLRSYVFGIEPIQSYYSAKGIAGNIIPAIATTNAVAAGLQILQAFSILKAQHEEKPAAEYCTYVNCVRQPTRNGLFLVSTELEPPNPGCYVCRSASIPLSLNISNWTLEDLLDKIIKKELGFEEPTLMLEDIIWEEGDGADTETYGVNLQKKLGELPCGGITNGSVLQIQDFSQDLEVDLVITQQDVWEKAEDDEDSDEFRYSLKGSKPVANSSKSPASTENPATEKDGDEDGDIVFLTNGKVKNSNPASPPAKKRKTEQGAIEID